MAILKTTQAFPAPSRQVVINGHIIAPKIITGGIIVTGIIVMMGMTFAGIKIQGRFTAAEAMAHTLA